MNVEEIRTKAQEVVKCRESARQVEIAQSVANKKITKTFTFDKVTGPGRGARGRGQPWPWC